MHRHWKQNCSGVPTPKPPALLLVSIVMSIAFSSSRLKGWPDFVMWPLYWAGSAFLAPSLPFNQHPCGCGLWLWAHCVIWFRAEREHLFYKAAAPSTPWASWREARTSEPAGPNPLKTNLSPERRTVTALWSVGWKCTKLGQGLLLSWL